MVEVQNVSKSFDSRKKRVVALDDVSFTAPTGRIYGLLGPNGAGKTTTLRCIATLLRADRGTIVVDGLDAAKEPRKVRDRVGFLTGDMRLSGTLTPRMMMRFFGELNHMDRAAIASRTEELAGYLGMGDFLDKALEKLSTGMKQKAAIALSLLHDPQVIIFDEPTSGLDLLAAKTVVDFLRDSRDRGKTVILSTHIMSEAEKLCDTVGILLGGRLAAEGTQEELRERFGRPSLEDVFFHLAAQHPGLAEQQNPEVSRVS